MTDADLITDLHAQLQSLTADLTRMQQERAKGCVWCGWIDGKAEGDSREQDLLARAEAAEAAQTRLREALIRYGQHDRACSLNLGQHVCTCGLEAALTPKEPS